MKTIIFLLVLGVFLFGCPQEKVLFKGIESAELPGYCAEFKEDVCGIYSCLTENCWCEQSPDKILSQGNTVLETEEQAVKEVQKYLDNLKKIAFFDNPKDIFEAKTAVKSNNVFYSVFAENPKGDEKVFIIAADGTIIKTQCGV